MNYSEISEFLINEGWTKKKDEVGSSIFRFHLNNFIIQTIPNLKKLSRGVRFSSMSSLTTKSFEVTASNIMGNKKLMSQPLIINADNGIVDDFDLSKLNLFVDQIIDWAKNQDITAALKYYREIPTDAPGAMPLRHLTALALNKDAAKLKYYLEEFQCGHNLGFVPYITQDLVERALRLAQENEI